MQVVCALIMLSLLLTFTRGLWIAMVVAVAALLFLTRRDLLKRFLLALTVMVAVAFTLFPTFRSRVTSIFDQSNYSNAGRIQVWRANWEMIKDHPILGVGHRLNSEHLPEYYDKIGIKNGFLGHAHNNWIQVAAGSGLPSLLFYVGFTTWFLIVAYRLFKQGSTPWARNIGLASFVAQISFHIGGLTQVNFMDGEVNHSFVVVVGLCFAGLRTQKKDPLERISK